MAIVRDEQAIKVLRQYTRDGVHHLRSRRKASHKSVWPTTKPLKC